jgi:RNA recognition motif-containing protein
MILLFIDNLSSETNKQEVERLFSRYGRIRSMKLTLSGSDSALAGSGFIEMEGNGGQKVISALDGRLFCGMYLRITEVLSTEKRQRDPGNSIASTQPNAANANNHVRQIYRLASVEKVVGTELVPADRDWYRYTLTSGSSRITGLRCGTMAEVTEYAVNSAEAFNLRNSINGNRSSPWASCRNKK